MVTTGSGPPGTEHHTARLPREVWVLVAANFAIAVGFGLVAPALPTFARGFDVSVTAASMVISAFSVARLVFAPVSGRLVTAIGEQRVYLTGLAIVAVTTGACALATAYWQVLALRTLSGIGSTMFTVSAVGLLIRFTPAPLRGRASGLWGSSFLLGSVTGPLIGGGLIAISLRAPFVVYAASLLVAIGIVWLLLRRSTGDDTATGDTVVTMSLREAMRHGSYIASLASSFTTGWTVFGVRMALIPLFVVEVLGREESFAGTAFAVFGAANVVMLLVSGKLSDLWGRKPMVLAGLAVSAIGTVWVGYTESVTAFLVATVVAGLGSGLLMPPQQATVADILGSKARGGTVLATFQMALDVGAIMGPVVAGLIADQISFAVAFAMAGGLSAAAILVWLPARETLPKDRRVTTTHPTPEEAVSVELPGK